MAYLKAEHPVSKPRVWRCSCGYWFAAVGDYITEWPTWKRAMLRATKGY